MKKVFISVLFTAILSLLSLALFSQVNRATYLNDIDATIYTNSTHQIKATADNALRKEEANSTLFFSDSGVKYLTPHTGWSLTGNSGTTAGTNFVGTSDSVDFVSKTNGIERMRILAHGGKIGIGTSTPAQALDVNGSIQIEKNGSFINFNNYYNAYFNLNGHTSFHLSRDSYNNRIIYMNDSLVIPNFVQLVANAGAGKVLTSDANGLGSWQTPASTYWSLTGNAGTTAGTNFIGTTDDISLIFKTKNIERLRIDSASGNVGVGTPSPLAKLDVVNTNTIIPTLQLYSNTTTYNAGQDLAICVNNANSFNNFVVAHNGQVGINTLPSAAYFLDVNGGIHSSTFARINGVSIGTMWGGQPSEINTDHTDTGNDLYLNYTNGGAVGVSSNSVHASAILDCESVTRGFLPPQMTTLQKLAIGTPKEGLIVYDLTLHQISYYNGSTWVNL